MVTSRGAGAGRGRGRRRQMKVAKMYRLPVISHVRRERSVPRDDGS